MWLLLFACTGPKEDDTPPSARDYGDVLSESLVGTLSDLVGDADRAFLCGTDSGVRVFDTADPYNPTLYQSYYADEPCYTAGILSNRVLIGSSEAFRTFSPNNMLVRGEHYTPFAVEALDISPGDDVAWLAGTDSEGQVWLEEVAYREDAAMTSRGLVPIDVARPVALAARPDGLLLLDADGVLHTLGLDLEVVGSWSPAGAVSRLFMAVGETDHAYISLGTGGLAIVDVSDLSAPVLAGSWPDGGGETHDLLLVGATMYVGRPGAVRVLDVSDPTVPAEIGAEDIALSGTPTHIWVDNRYAYLADADSGILSIVSVEE